MLKGRALYSGSEAAPWAPCHEHVASFSSISQLPQRTALFLINIFYCGTISITENLPFQPFLVHFGGIQYVHAV